MPDPTIPAESLRPFLIELLQAHSLFEYDAEIVADAVLYAHEVGNADDGLAHLPGWIALIGEGQIDPRGRPLVIAESPALQTFDGSAAMGPIGLTHAVRWAIETAPRTGVALAVVKNGRDAGCLSYYTKTIVDAGLVGLCQTAGYRTAREASYANARLAASMPQPVSLTGSQVDPAAGGDCPEAFAHPLVALAVLLSNGRTPVHRQSAPNPHQCEHLVLVVDPAHGIGADTVGRCIGREYKAEAPEEAETTISLDATLRDHLAHLASGHDLALPW